MLSQISNQQAQKLQAISICKVWHGSIQIGKNFNDVVILINDVINIKMNSHILSGHTRRPTKENLP